MTPGMVVRIGRDALTLSVLAVEYGDGNKGGLYEL